MDGEGSGVKVRICFSIAIYIYLIAKYPTNYNPNLEEHVSTRQEPGMHHTMCRKVHLYIPAIEKNMDVAGKSKPLFPAISSPRGNRQKACTKMKFCKGLLKPYQALWWQK